MNWIRKKSPNNSIVLILDGFKQGGIQQAYLLLLEQYSLMFKEVSILILESSNQDLPIPSYPNLHIKKFEYRKFRKIRLTYSLAKELRRKKPKYVLVSIYLSQILSALILPSYAHLIWIENNTYNNRSWFQWKLMKILARKTISIVSISEEVKRITESKIKLNSVVIPCPIKIDLHNVYIGPRNEDFVFIGRIIDQKNPELLIRCFAKFCELYGYQSKLHVIGDGYLLESIIQLSKDLKVFENCIFYGNLDNIKKRNILLHCKTLISTSKFEGLGIVRFEALAVGCCLVSTITGGSNFILNYDQFGVYLIENTNIQIEMEIVMKMKMSLNKELWKQDIISRREMLVNPMDPGVVSKRLLNERR